MGNTTLYYDLHLHSCLSPCGDREMTVNNIANMAALKGLSVVALTDHNSCKNCPAFLKAAQSAGIWAIPGMELCTSEEIHLVCLFPRLENAMAFDDYVFRRLPPVPGDGTKRGMARLLDHRGHYRRGGVLGVSEDGEASHPALSRMPEQPCTEIWLALTRRFLGHV